MGLAHKSWGLQGASKPGDLCHLGDTKTSWSAGSKSGQIVLSLFYQEPMEAGFGAQMQTNRSGGLTVNSIYLRVRYVDKSKGRQRSRNR